MASPQTENGFFRLANEIAEQLSKVNLSSYESRFLWALIRKTYGFNKKEDRIANSQFVEMTQINKFHISRTKKKLLNKNMIYVRNGKIGLQKNYDEWVQLPKQVTSKKLPKQVKPVTQTGNKKLPKQVDTKDNKNNITKDNKLSTDNLGGEVNELIAEFEEVNPSFEKFFKNKTQRAAIERLLRKFDKEKIRSTIRYLPRSNTEKYAPTITTPIQLEDKLAQLIAFYQKQKSSKGLVI